MAATDAVAARAEVAKALALVKPYPFLHDAAELYGNATEALALAGDRAGATAMAEKARAGIRADRYLGEWMTQRVNAQIALAQR